ncbi:hypothetical protein BJA5080_01657 [Bradyrhizobium diazoefficiens SEMIA 5080]|uniref:Uncharacterized protein n=1 Tax=Bradyrhizobium diazoefficiens SEMIA 5080 TaxID=754504 RepID=A0A837C6N6_9BRAD|nr:hypothetical protein BJA5080_01657 [Bradyrhizobium diazoefficiens SEMIA 5080]
MPASSTDPADGSEVGSDALALPIAVAGRLGSLRPLQFLRRRLGVVLGLDRRSLSARLGLGQRALGCRRQRLAIGNGWLVTHRQVF